MTASTRFIGMALFTWAGVRAVSLGLVPGADALALDRSAQAVAPPIAGLPAVETTEFPPLEPPAPVTRPASVLPASYPLPPPPLLTNACPTYPIYLRLPRYARPGGWPNRAAAVSQLASAEALLPEPRTLPLAAAPPARETTLSRLAALVMPGWRSPVGVGQSVPTTDSVAPLLTRRKRLELSAWSMMRGKAGDILGATSLATSGATLGGSQAGARLSYWLTPQIAASLRASTPLGGARGGEFAAGVRYQPFRSIPFSVTAERRQRFGRAGGRNDFALFMEGGVWDRPMPAGFRINGYAQAGVVGIKTHDLFGDGAATLTRPLWKRVSGGFGVWGGAQSHLYRLDAGPRLTVAMTKSIRIHLDYRQRLLGTASPSSGPAITMAGDF